MRIRSIISLCLLCVLLGGPAQASVDKAFANLMQATDSSVNGAGVFAGRSHINFTAGSANIYFQPKTISMFSLDPPSLSAGCGGISAHFGGFSFINGQEIQQMLQSISQGATAYLFQLAITQLCPQCADVLKDVARKLQEISALSINSCEAGAALAQGAIDLGADLFSSTCQNMAAETGANDDQVAARASTCEDENAAITYFKNLWETSTSAGAGNATTPSQCTMLEGAGMAANSDPWLMLWERGITANYPLMAVLIQSLMGGESIEDDGQDRKSEQAVAPTLTATQFFDLFLCGADPNNWPESPPAWAIGDPDSYTAMRGYCMSTFGTQGKASTIPDVLVCSAAGAFDAAAFSDGTCAQLMPVKISELDKYMSSAGLTDPLISGADIGFLQSTAKTLIKAVDAVASNTPLSTDALRLMNLSPFPLYRAINIAAVYPDISRQIVTENALALGTIIGIHYVRYAMGQVLRSRKDNANYCMPKTLLEQMARAQEQISSEVGKRYDQVNKLYARQTAIMEQVNSVNQAILQQVYQQGILGQTLAGGR